MLGTLKGLKVLDFTQIGAGPTCSMYLGDMGADVVKVEQPSGDLGRKLGLPWVDVNSPIFEAFNRNKRSVCINLNSIDGKEIAIKLASKADVLIESFRPNTMKKFGLDYDSINKINERIVYCSVSAYGQTGPMSHKVGVDGIIQGTSGLMSLIGYPNSEPCKVQAPVVDVSTGHISTIAILSQLLERERTGKGGYSDVNLLSSAVALQQSAITTFMGTRELPQRMGSAAPYAAPNEAFETSDGWIMVAAYSGNRWESLCEVLNIAEIANKKGMKTSADRVINRQEMKNYLSPRFKTQTSTYWQEKLEAVDILCGNVATYKDLISDPQVQHLNLLTEAISSDGKLFISPAFPVNTRAGAMNPSIAAPRCGQHSTEILAEIGYNADEIELIYKNGAIFT
jgi:crotonobetainyl-CoA:carnitine CoA-transferase CaiB-like acyl-CoA transferase